MIAIIDYGAGNIQSVNKALKYIGCDCVVTRDKDMILKADGAVLPGVGSFGDTMDTMESYGIKDTVLDFIKTKNSKFDTPNEDEFIQSLKWSLGSLSKKEEKILREYFNTTYKHKEQKEFLTWAFISWEKAYI